jgi:AmmeMemoRadiSam system protein A
MVLQENERQELLRVARLTLELYLQHHQTLQIDAVSDGLLEHRGAFVTLHKKDRQLRGCIGTFESRAPLITTVQRMAIAAATTDPRFPAVRLAELVDLHFEISALTPLRRAKSEEIIVGEHGIFITNGYQRGVLLPQVATENGWNRQTFLEHTCLKAGLPSQAWKETETVIEIFSAEVFGEEHP